ncbi:MAG: hypothetical protein Q9220_004817 [cf. Caloplaca sp. 1 TL-2023]
MRLLLSVLVLTIRATQTQAKSTATTTAAAAAPTSSTSYTSPSDFTDTILAAHNLYRHQHNASSLTWNTTLATIGAKQAKPCVFAHSHGATGENLAAGYPNTTAAVDGWGDEGKKYDFGKASFSDSTGHFTQVVWKASTSVGCGATYCAGKQNTPGWFLVCEYWPSGNVQTQFKQNVQAAVSAGARTCFDGCRWGSGLGLLVVVWSLAFW